MNQVNEIKHEVSQYIIKNIFASLGLSMYVIVDTLFIAVAAGTLGLTTLNLVLPIFNLFNSIGLLFGIGGSALYSLNKINHPKKVENLFSQLLLFCAGLGILFAIFANLFPHQILHFLGANEQTLDLATMYLRIISFSGPFFMCNYVAVNFIRNDGNPKLTMIATLTETIFVVIVDWILIFVLDLKMEGAALATLFAPATSLLILTNHRHFKKRTLKLKLALPQLKNLLAAGKIGIPSFFTEMSTGVSIFAFNWVLLKLAGNDAIAAYGVIANIAIVVLALFNGVALGVQPIASREYGRHKLEYVKAAILLGLKVSLALAIVAYIVLLSFKYPIIQAFNAENNQALITYAANGMPIYFVSVFFANFNIVIMMSLAAINQPKGAFVMSLGRGYVILLTALGILAYFMGLSGVWAAVPCSEFVVCCLGFYLIYHQLFDYKK